MKLSVSVLVISVLAAIGLAQLRPAERWSATADQMPIPAAGMTELVPESAAAEAARVSPTTREAKTAAVVASSVPVRSADDATPAVRAVVPTRLVIPALDLDAVIQPAGVNEDEQLDVPTADKVGWYRYGSSPGEAGAAVLAAHVDLDGQLGVFFELKELAIGASFRIEYSDESSQLFEVVDQQLYEKTSLPASLLFRRTGSPVVHLATCGGTFDPVTRSYLGNRVVTARPIDAVR